MGNMGMKVDHLTISQPSRQHAVVITNMYVIYAEQLTWLTHG